MFLCCWSYYISVLSYIAIVGKTNGPVMHGYMKWFEGSSSTESGLCEYNRDLGSTIND
jgi:hypothetical protein